MGITISFGIQKGGVGKTTSCAITAHLLSKDARVLAVDFDSQGNLTEFLTRRDIYDFTGNTVLEAIKDKDPRPYIVNVKENESIDKALKRFKKKFEKTGVLRELRNRQAYEKRSVTRRTTVKRAIYKQSLNIES